MNIRWGYVFGFIAAALIIYLIVDAFAGKTYYDRGIIKDSSYQREYWTTSCSTVNKTTTCHPVHHPEQCEIYVKGDEFDGWADVNCHYYFSPLHINDVVNVKWYEGGWTGIKWNKEAYP